MADTATTTTDGIIVRGGYEGSRQGKEFTRRDGSKGQPVELGIRSGDDVIAVRYDSADKAGEALRDAGGPEVGELVELPVYARLVKDFDRRFAFITYEGRNSESAGGGWA